MVGYLGLTSAKGEAEMVGSFRKGLREAGFEEGRNVTVELRFAEGDISRLPAGIELAPDGLADVGCCTANVRF